MFNTGDKVVCIDQQYRKKYNLPNTILEVTEYKDIRYKKLFSENFIICFKDIKYGYNYNCFMLLKEYRKLKLKKIETCSK